MGVPEQCTDMLTELVRQSRDGILLTDESGTLVEWNPAMERMTGLLRSRVLGKKLWDVHFLLIAPEKRTPEYLENLQQLIRSAISTGRSAEPGPAIEYEIQCPDNKERILESCMFTVPAGNALMGGAILRDITERKRSERAILDLNQKLNLMSSTARHDINNQLTIISGYLSLLESGTPSMKSGDIIRILQGAAARIQRIVKFTKDYQQIGVKPPVWQDLGETIRLAKTTADAGAVRYSVGNTCNNLEIYADPMLIKVFSSLIDNSLRHGDKVSEIRIGCNREEHRLVIVYEDDGIGISETIRPVLFERGKGKNTGYGMFLIREILTITGLTISESGEPGKGARFGIVVPECSFRPKEKKQL